MNQKSGETEEAALLLIKEVYDSAACGGQGREVLAEMRKPDAADLPCLPRTDGESERKDANYLYTLS